jgi:DNA gyrase subunit B
VGDETDVDEIFAKLMGDQVEPRRELIEKNALNVSSLVSTFSPSPPML